MAGFGMAGRSTGAVAAEGPPTLLVAGRRTLDVDGRAASVLGLRQPDGTAGLFTEVGSAFRVTLRNDIRTDTLIHWHGLKPPSSQDGVPGISAPPIPAGGSAEYDFPLAFPGTFWMHSHQGLQEQSLLSAPLIIRPVGGIGDRQEVVMMLHDFAFRSPDEISAGLRRGKKQAPAGMVGMGKMAEAPGMAMDLNDVAYDAFLANDRTLADPQVVKVEPGGRVLLRVINASASSNFLIDVGAVEATLVAVDGHAVRPVRGAIFPLAIAQRVDIEVRIGPGRTAAPILAVLEGERKRTGIVLATAGAQVRKLADMAPKASAPLDLRLEERLRAIEPLAAKAPARLLQVDLTGDMASYVWSLNGAIYGQDKPLLVAQGERVVLAMTNKTMMSHPMHLHGHTFQVVAIDGKRLDGAVRDTVLVPPMASVSVAFEADNPGHWAFHCHNLYHMEAGMMTTVRYEGA
jgi:FtsP/CotA-like multicopper oxidase with cupredoxin domain